MENDFDALTPEFFDFAEKMKRLFEEKKQKTKAFKEIWVKHNQEIADITQKAQDLKNEFMKAAAKARLDNSVPNV